MRQKLLTFFAAILCAASINAQVDAPLTFEAVVAGATVNYSGTPTVQFSTDGTIWNDYSSAITLAAVGDKVSFRGNNSSYDGAYFECTNDCYIYGNIMSLVDATDYATATALTKNKTFRRLFYFNDKIKNHPTKDLVLPATTLTNSCYSGMFLGCEGLTRAPELPATSLQKYCYDQMFMDCTGLTEAPTLPATTLANGCYYYMFYGCTHLSSVTCYATTTAEYATTDWLNGVASTGTFYAPSDGVLNNEVRGVSAIPSGWTINTDRFTPLTFEAKEAGATVTYTLNDTKPVQYSLNGGTWTDYDGAITLAAVGDKVSFQGNNASYNSDGAKFTCSEDCYLYGNIMSLVDADNYATATTLTESYTFSRMFFINSHIKNHASKDLVLPATTLTKSCYAFMFEGCTGLTSAPVLPATTLASSCYMRMFTGCTGLTSAPALPVTTLALGCYSNMFQGCTGLTSAPALPATTLTDLCYSSMFSFCTGLTSAPELPATTLADNCYSYMFYNCTGLTTAPELPVTTLTNNCYEAMFQGCTGLTSAPALPATTLTGYCYEAMFQGCTGLTSAPELPATTLAEGCYYEMFKNCTSLISAPELPVTTLALGCYVCMFQGCTGLTSAPALPATTLAEYCYYQMFDGCTSLSSVTCYATVTAENATTDWINGVAASGTFYAPTNGVLNNEARGVSAIPSGWNVAYLMTGNEDPDHAGDYYSTFFDSSIKYTVPAGVEAYVAELSGDALNLTKIAEEGEVLPANTAVILKSTVANYTLMPTTDVPITVTATNNLHGVDAATAAPANCYVLSGHSTDNSVTGVGFYQYTGTLKAHKAYAVIDGGIAYAPKKLRFVFNTTTGVESIQPSEVRSQKVIENGVLYIIKNGVRYNAQGQIVK